MQEVEPQAPPCTVTATGAKANSKRLAVSIENPRIVSDIRISDNVTISVAPKTRGDEEGDPFKPSRKIQRSPTIGGRPDIEVAEESVVYRNWIEISSRQDGGDSTYRKSYHKVKDVNMGKYLLMTK
ncbi:uncharacterized protein LOC126876899 [Bombus huntii]|uniref:uncharacterized protein LOC126875712 n=1 Tax=Bombus huntii TaxID=85661 RepID=UPI0021AA5680|nr:uncharacterized protein LOC126875712 [Bombus huntii]XP_050494560.1 uncharacterized protein LOC126875713 [Bombus huntii]XP_050494561.1 uncharacterized protein LOC126875714 [Bombus huntii]XP_050494562.1 uncharacterized protein LOC126875715 [Bombus huntii]XP_050494563.1 uncharacterized protein LOC126875716 [Bombus huntii]XP_050495089.1 uncharacterized protein LOC126876282 [Bombus huntii]XP_050495681.1 uncharacterized protein LOC126876899 [Bombus huntii]